MNYTESSPPIRAEFLGLQSYQDILEQQLLLAESIRGTRAIHVLGLEFSPVITLGVRGSRQDDLAVNIQTDIPVVQTDRGGQATMHTPGQLVVYPMIDLKSYGVGVRDFVCVLTKATAALLKTYGIESKQGESPGLYTMYGKIAFLGIRLDRGVVRHGLALNVSNDTAYFNSIRSCGVTSAKLDRVQNYESNLELATLFHIWTKEFKRELDLVQRANTEICGLQLSKDPLSIEVDH